MARVAESRIRSGEASAAIAGIEYANDKEHSRTSQVRMTGIYQTLLDRQIDGIGDLSGAFERANNRGRTGAREGLGQEHVHLVAAI